MGDNYDLYIQNDTLRLGGILENFKDACLKTSDPDPTHFYFAPALIWIAASKIAKIQ